MSAAPRPERSAGLLVVGQLFADVVFGELPGGPRPGHEIWTSSFGHGPGGIANFALAGARLGVPTAIAAAGQEGRIVEMSWYGDRPVAMPLGGAFHSRRLSIVSSQVGSVPPGRRARWSNRRRLETALALLADPALDVLVREETAFDDLPDRYASILGDAETLCHRIRYARN